MPLYSRRERPRRVCHIAATTEGATWMLEQLRELRDRYGYEVTAVVSGACGSLVDALHAEGIKVHAFDFRFEALGDTIALAQTVVRLARFFRRQRFDVVQTHLFHSMIIGRLAAWLADVPVRASMIAGPFHLEAQTPRWIDGTTCWMDSVVIASCRYTGELYQSLGVPPHRLALIYYGPNAAAFDPRSTPPADIRRELGWAADTPVIGMVAYFYPVLGPSSWSPPFLHGRAVKGHEYLIRAMLRVLERAPEAKLVLVGRGWEAAGVAHLEEMRALVHDLDLDDVVAFTGFRSDVPALLREFDVSVQPSLNENLGGTIESLLMECPTVATRVGGLPDSIHDGVTGVLVEPAEPEDLARGILRLLQDPEGARRMAQAGRRFMLSRFTLECTVRDLDALYRQHSTRRRSSRGYRLGVIALRALALGPVCAYLALRLWVIDMLFLPRWQAGWRPWSSPRRPDLPSIPPVPPLAEIAKNWALSALGRAPTSFGLRARIRRWLGAGRAWVSANALGAWRHA